MGKNIPLKIALSDEIEQFVARKKTRSTRATYKGAYQQFLICNRKKHGGKATIPDFVEAVYDDLDKPLRERQRVAENELSGYVAFLQSLDPPKSNNTVRTYIAALRARIFNFVKKILDINLLWAHLSSIGLNCPFASYSIVARRILNPESTCQC